jgi:hypothetical protein
MKTVTFGLDPEFVICNPNNKFLSAIPLIEGRKGREIPLSKGGLLSDNVNAEVNVHPSDDFQNLVDNFASVIKESHQHLQKKTKCSLHAIASIEFDEDQLQDEECIAFGCNPDFNPYTVRANEIRPDAPLSNFRTTGGHVHIGYNHEHHAILKSFIGKLTVVKAMDLFVGLPYVLIDKDPTSAKRRGLYGVAGAHRSTNYGVEYRTLPSSWLRNIDLFKLIFDSTQFAVDFSVNGNVDELINTIGVKDLQTMINTSDIAKCRTVYNELIFPILPKNISDMIETLIQQPEASSNISEYWC